MLEGFWIVQFAGMEGKGGGVVLFERGKVFGGDSGFTYIGTCEEVDGKARAKVLVQNFDPLIGNVLGIKGDFWLHLELAPSGSNELRGQASTPAAPGFGLKVKLTRRARLD